MAQPRTVEALCASIRGILYEPVKIAMEKLVSRYLSRERFQYIQAIQGVGTVVQDYDTDKLFPSFGNSGTAQSCSSTTPKLYPSCMRASMRFVRL